MVIVFLNGKFLLEKEASIPITDRGFLFGDGVFTTIRVQNGIVEFWQEHLERLKQHAAQIQLYLPVIELSWIQRLLMLNQAQTGCWRLKIIVTGGSCSQLNFPKNRRGNLLITLKPYMNNPFQALHLCLFPQPIHRPTSGIKSLAYLDRLWIRQYAQENGCDDAIVCSSFGELLETSFSNLFWFDGEQIGIPDCTLPYLQGIFLNQVIKKLPFPKIEFKGGIHSIPKRAAVYLCNALTHIQPVIKIESESFNRQEKWETQITFKASQLIKTL